MKKQIVILGTLALTVALSQNVNAQTPAWNFTAPNTITTLNTTHVGINTTVSPSWALTVNGAFGFQGDYASNPGNTDLRHIAGHSRNGLVLWSTEASGGFTNGSAILLNSNHANGQISDKGSMTFSAAPINGTDPAFNFVIGNDGFSSRMIINKDGQVGLGTNILHDDNLTVSGAISFSQTWSDPGSGHYDWYKHIKGRSRDYGMVLYSNDEDWANSSGIILHSTNVSGSEEGIGFVSSSNNSNDAYRFRIHTPASGDWSQPLTIQKDGKVVIGTVSSTPGDYNLYVENGILTSKIKVAIQGSGEWSDYVFADNYDLRSLDEVESFIKQNKHLPDVPSAENVVKNGVDVGKMDATLLQKIEELTLYVIQQQKEIENLKILINN